MGSVWNLLTGSTVSEQLAYSALRGITLRRSSGRLLGFGAQGSATNTVFVSPI
jgi:hypothetical protein